MSNDLMKIGELVKLELKQSAVVTPANYAFENALKSAWLILQETLDRNKQPALKVCTPDSVQNAILNMALLGLNPAKKQCYFVVYGKQLQCIMSYMGAQMTAKLVDPRVIDIRAQVIYAGDQLDIDIENGRDIIKKHSRKFQSISKADIIGAYAVAVDAEDKPLFCEIMTIDDIKASWKQSKMNAVAESGAINQGSTHGKFTGEMSKRTVINRLCKKIINTSDDSALIKSVETIDEDRDEAEIIRDEIDQNANKKMLDFTPAEQQTAEAHPDFTPEEVGNATVSDNATDAQCRHIFELAKKANTQEKILENVGGFIGREIGGLKELTAAEAKSYIDMAETELSENDDGPDWA